MGVRGEKQELVHRWSARTLGLNSRSETKKPVGWNYDVGRTYLYRYRRLPARFEYQPSRLVHYYGFGGAGLGFTAPG